MPTENRRFTGNGGFFQETMSETAKSRHLLMMDLSGKGFTEQSSEKSEKDSGGDTGGTGGQTTAEHPQQTVFGNGFFNAFGEGITEAGQGNRCAGTGKINKRLIQTKSGQYHTAGNIGDKNTSRCQFCFVDEYLCDQTKRTAH